MNQLIWFSIPGAIVTGTLYLINFSSIINPQNGALLLGLSLLNGFVFHQIYRIIFETYKRGYAGEWRGVLRKIIKAYKKKYKIKKNNKGYLKAFLIWETTFYSEGFPEGFRKHDEGSWHYIQSFWGISVTALLSFITFVGYLYITKVELVGFSEDLIVWIYIGLIVMFYLKGKLTFDRLNEQEMAIFKIHQEKCYNPTAKKLLKERIK
jgi:hypothetical protein